MRLPLLLSVPHAGLAVPPEARPYCILSAAAIAADGDEGARDIYSLEGEVQAFLTTDIARAIVDLNRAEDDRRADGVVKTHTCWNVPVYDPFPPDEVIESLLRRYYRPYHRDLRRLAGSGVLLGLDGHTMAAGGPPVGPDPGGQRPALCLGNADGTCPDDWFDALARSLEEAFELPVSRNVPFRGGFITRSHAAELPWVQLEMSRGPFLPVEEKRARLLRGLRAFFRRVG